MSRAWRFLTAEVRVPRWIVWLIWFAVVVNVVRELVQWMR